MYNLLPKCPTTTAAIVVCLFQVRVELKPAPTSVPEQPLVANAAQAADAAVEPAMFQGQMRRRILVVLLRAKGMG